MKRMISTTLLLAVMSNSVLAYAPNNLNETISPKEERSLDSVDKFGVLFTNFKRSVLVNGSNIEPAIERLVSDANVGELTIDDVKGYAINNMSIENYKEFSKTLDRGIMSLNGESVSPKKMARVIENLIESESRKSAQWVSCDAGLAIGIPLMVAGIVTGIVALSLKKVMISDVEKKYIDDRKARLDKYTRDEQNRQDTILTFEGDIEQYNILIQELNDKINSGLYGSLEVQNMQMQINTYQMDIVSVNTSIAQLQNDQPQLYQSFQNDLQYLNELEVNELARSNEQNRRTQETQKILGVTTAITIPLGLILTLSGASKC